MSTYSTVYELAGLPIETHDARVDLSISTTPPEFGPPIRLTLDDTMAVTDGVVDAFLSAPQALAVGVNLLLASGVITDAEAGELITHGIIAIAEAGR